MKTMKELAQEALDVQDACNLSGVIHSWSEVITQLRKILPNGGTQVLSLHPINKLFAAKVIELTCMGFAKQEKYEEAFRECERMVKEEIVEKKVSYGASSDTDSDAD